jgi:hypothetical protein
VPDHAPPAPGPYLLTVSGRWVNPFDPDPDQLDAGDIARALANLCRFGGHCRPFYSVAQHSVMGDRVRLPGQGRETRGPHPDSRGRARRPARAPDGFS